MLQQRQSLQPPAYSLHYHEPHGRVRITKGLAQQLQLLRPSPPRQRLNGVILQRRVVGLQRLAQSGDNRVVIRLIELVKQFERLEPLRRLIALELAIERAQGRVGIEFVQFLKGLSL